MQSPQSTILFPDGNILRFSPIETSTMADISHWCSVNGGGSTGHIALFIAGTETELDDDQTYDHATHHTLFALTYATGSVKASINGRVLEFRTSDVYTLGDIIDKWYNTWRQEVILMLGDIECRRPDKYDADKHSNLSAIITYCNVCLNSKQYDYRFYVGACAACCEYTPR